MSKIVRTFFSQLDLSKHRIPIDETGLLPSEASCCTYVVFLGDEAPGSEALGNLCAIYVPPANCVLNTRALPSLSVDKEHTAYCIGAFVSLADKAPALLCSPKHLWQINSSGYTYIQKGAEFIRCAKPHCPGVIEVRELTGLDNAVNQDGAWTRCPLDTLLEFSQDRGFFCFFSHSFS